MTLSKKLLAGLVAAVAVTAASVADAAVPDGAGVIHGCYDKQSGQLRVTDTQTSVPKGCTSKEAALAWNQQGPQGPPGLSKFHEIYAPSSPYTTGTHVVTAKCPAGEVALSTGYKLHNEYPLPALEPVVESGAGIDVIAVTTYQNSGGIAFTVDQTGFLPGAGAAQAEVWVNCAVVG